MTRLTRQDAVTLAAFKVEGMAGSKSVRVAGMLLECMAGCVGICTIAERGRMGWQKTSGYNQRAKAEAAMSRYKRVIGDTLRSQAGPAQQVETQIAVKALNRMLGLGRPDSVRAA